MAAHKTRAVPIALDLPFLSWAGSLKTTFMLKSKVKRLDTQAHVDFLPKIYLEDQIADFNSYSLKNFCNKLKTTIIGKHLGKD